MVINELNLQKQNNTFTLSTSQKYAAEDIIINTAVKKAVLTSNDTSFDVECPISANTTETLTLSTSNNKSSIAHADGRTLGVRQINPIAQYKDVIFIDYDGTIRYSYTANEFANLTSLPPNPTHQGLIAQGWNWTLTNAKTVVAANGYLTIGQNYITDDDKTRIYVRLDEQRKSPCLGIGINGTVDIDWGDGTQHSTLTGTAADTIVYTNIHEYASGGQYVIKLTITGTAYLKGTNNSNGGCALLRYRKDNSTTVANDARNKYYANAIKKVELGANIARIQTSSFYNCYSMQSITIPSTLNYSTIGINAFYSCHALVGIVIPNGVVQLNEGCFMYCYGIRYFALPYGYAALGKSTFNNCQAVQQLYIKSGAKDLPHTYLNYAQSLTKVILPSTLQTISNNAFVRCEALVSLTIPSNVTSIGSGAFQNCYSLKELHFLPTSPPTGVSSITFSGVPVDCIIYVPENSLSAYTSASNYPSSATYTYIGVPNT